MQNLTFNFYSFLFQYFHMTSLFVICILFALFAFTRGSRGLLNKIKINLVLLSVIFNAFFGARLLHAVIENPILLRTPAILLQQFDGMTFNGALLFGFLSFFFLLKLFPKDQRERYWDIIAWVLPFCYGLLRIGCFTNGCCWGKPTGASIAVKYYDSAVMPWLGIPVHPVQLYDSVLGFLIFFLLLRLYRKSTHQGKLFTYFLFLYAVGRFFTEFFRGDSFRGDNLIFHMSTSQLVSVFLLLVTLMHFKKRGLHV